MKASIGIKIEAKALLLDHGTTQFITSQLDDAPSNSGLSSWGLPSSINSAEKIPYRHAQRLTGSRPISQ